MRARSAFTVVLVLSAASAAGIAQQVENAGATINTRYHEAFSAITPDGLTVLISSDRPGGYGEAREDAFWGAASYDIYIAHRETRSSPWNEPQNLGPRINTAASEHSAMLSADGHFLYFVSSRTDLEHYGGSDLFVSYRSDPTDDTGWDEPVNLGGSVNTVWTESCPFFVEAGGGDTSLLYFVQMSSGDPASLDIKVSEFDRATGAWSHPETMGISTEFGDGHFDPAHGYIWGFGFDGGIGASDIWVLDAMSGTGSDTTGKLVNLGAAINTKYDEIMPSATADGTLLVFNSDRPGGYGGFDIYEARLD